MLMHTVSAGSMEPLGSKTRKSTLLVVLTSNLMQIPYFIRDSLTRDVLHVNGGHPVAKDEDFFGRVNKLKVVHL